MNWINAKDRLPTEGNQYLVAVPASYPGVKYWYKLAWWTPNISEKYPFKFYDEYKDRVGGGWVATHPEEDYELRGVEWWCEIEPPVKEEEKSK